MPDLRYDDEDDPATWAGPIDDPEMRGLEHVNLEELENHFTAVLGYRRKSDLIARVLEVLPGAQVVHKRTPECIVARSTDSAVDEPTFGHRTPPLDRCASPRLCLAAVLIRSPHYGEIWLAFEPRAIPELAYEASADEPPRPVVLAEDVLRWRGKSMRAVSLALDVALELTLEAARVFARELAPPEHPDPCLVPVDCETRAAVYNAVAERVLSNLGHDTLADSEVEPSARTEVAAQVITKPPKLLQDGLPEVAEAWADVRPA